MEPLFFGSQGNELYGVYHAPTLLIPRTTGVVLCAPFGEESIRAHRAYRLLACQLAMAGFPSLRFDYYGCGDSYGDRKDGTLMRWIADIQDAIDLLRDGSDVKHVVLLGCRLGGSLAYMVGAQRHDVVGMILWGPVLHGTAYLREMAHIQKQWVQRAFVDIKKSMPADHPEYFGFPLTKWLVEDITGVSLRMVECQQSKRILLIDHEQQTDGDLLSSNHATRDAIALTYRMTDDHPIWMNHADSEMESCRMPVHTLEAIRSWMCEGF